MKFSYVSSLSVTIDTNKGQEHMGNRKRVNLNQNKETYLPQYLSAWSGQIGSLLEIWIFTTRVVDEMLIMRHNKWTKCLQGGACWTEGLQDSACWTEGFKGRANAYKNQADGTRNSQGGSAANQSQADFWKLTRYTDLRSTLVTGVAEINNVDTVFKRNYKIWTDLRSSLSVRFVDRRRFRVHRLRVS